VIRGSAYGLRRAVATADARLNLEAIDEEVDHADRLVDDLLALARLRASVLLVRPVRTDCAPLVRGVVRRRRASGDGHGATLRYHGPAAGAWADVDPTRLEQVVGNLVDNAVRHGGGEVHVRLQVDRHTLRLDVEDDGAGIDEAEAHLLFEPFVQGTRSGPGTGLGLAIVRELAAAHGGAVVAANRPAGGARFRVVLPVVAAVRPVPDEPIVVA
jgi:signal transduction histidine kinase